MSGTINPAGARDAPELKLDDFLCFALYSASHAFSRLYKPLLDTLGLTYPQYLAMVALWEKDGQTVSEVGEKLGLESNTLTPLLKRLEGAGFLARRRDASDERVVRLTLTQAGRALRDRALAVPGCVFDATKLSESQARKLTTEISHLRHMLETAKSAV